MGVFCWSFTTAAALVTTLARAHQAHQPEEKLKQLVQPRLLIVDEIGYLPLDRLGANLFFQLVSCRYECGSVLITSNQSPTGWGQVFGDQVLAMAILDRLLCFTTRRSSTSRARATGSRRRGRLTS